MRINITRLERSITRSKQEASVLADYQEKVRQYTLGAVLAAVSIIGIIDYGVSYFTKEKEGYSTTQNIQAKSKPQNNNKSKDEKENIDSKLEDKQNGLKVKGKIALSNIKSKIDDLDSKLKYYIKDTSKPKEPHMEDLAYLFTELNNTQFEKYKKQTERIKYLIKEKKYEQAQKLIYKIKNEIK